MKQPQRNGYSRAARFTSDRIDKTVRRYRLRPAKTPRVAQGELRIVPLGGQDGIGEKNMIVVEYGDDAIVLDCGFELGITIPGVNYAIPATDYLATIQHKLRGYVTSHGHLDHIGGLPHIVPQFPAPIFGSRFTVGMIEGIFEKSPATSASYTPDCRVLDMDSHETVQLGVFRIELVRVTHAIPESSAIVVDTPAGRIINTGDFRLDPEPLDAMPSDIARLRQLGDEGVLLLMSESTNATKPGRTPTEHTLQDSFYELIGRTPGRLVVAVFSTNMNRIQMIVNAAHHYGRRVALDGRSMMTVAEMAVRLGNLKIPKGVFVPMHEAATLPPEQVVIVCTGGQGEPGAALSRMAVGEHKYITLQPSDSVVVSSTPIVGNEQSYGDIGDHLSRIGVTLYRHPTHEIDGCGPLHVSGHAARDEHAEMIQLVRPRYLMPIYGGALPRRYHQQIGRQQGIPDDRIIMVDNGQVVDVTRSGVLRLGARVPAGAQLVDTTGAVVPEVVSKDRLALQQDGFVVCNIVVDARGRLVSSPDIVTRGYINAKDSPQLLDALRKDIRRLLASRMLRSRDDIQRAKQIVREGMAQRVFNETAKTPAIIPIVTVVPRGSTGQRLANSASELLD